MRKKLFRIIIGTVLIVFVLIIIGFLYLYNNGLSGQSNYTKVKEGQIKIACVGDSITYGHGVSGWRKNNYPAVLQGILGQDYHVSNFGSSGSCVNPDGDQPYIDRSVYQDSLKYDADILVFMLGTNDSKPENWNGAEAFIEDYKELLHTYLEKENPPKVYIGLCSEAFYIDDKTEGVAEFDIQPMVVDEIVSVIQSYAEETEMEVVNIHSLTEEHPEWFEKDGIHPNKDGAKAIAETVVEVIKNE